MACLTLIRTQTPTRTHVQHGHDYHRKRDSSHGQSPVPSSEDVAAAPAYARASQTEAEPGKPVLSNESWLSKNGSAFWPHQDRGEESATRLSHSRVGVSWLAGSTAGQFSRQAGRSCTIVFKLVITIYSTVVVYAYYPRMGLGLVSIRVYDHSVELDSTSTSIYPSRP